MEILKEGNGENWSMTIKCELVKDNYGFTWDNDIEHCGSILRISKEDVFCKRWSKYGGLDGVDYLVQCPKCRSRIYLLPETLPSYVKASAKERIS